MQLTSIEPIIWRWANPGQVAGAVELCATAPLRTRGAENGARVALGRDDAGRWWAWDVGPDGHALPGWRVGPVDMERAVQQAAGVLCQDKEHKGVTNTINQLALAVLALGLKQSMEGEGHGKVAQDAG